MLDSVAINLQCGGTSLLSYTLSPPDPVWWSSRFAVRSANARAHKKFLNIGGELGRELAVKERQIQDRGRRRG